jgi:hypothetical protein
MAYDEALAGRIRQLIGSDPELTEKKMFGGLAFFIRGNVAMTKATVVNMRGRDMHGWLRVSSGDLRTDDQLAPWVEIGAGYARSLQPK